MASPIEEQGRYQDGNSIFENVFIQGTLNVATANEKLVVHSDGITIDTITTNSDGKTTVSGDVQIDGDELFIADSIKHVGDNDTLISFPSNDTINFRTNGTERFRITDNGQVGINSSIPSATLDVQDVTGSNDLVPVLLLGGGGDANGDLAVNSGEHLQTGHFDRGTGTFTERFRIQADGNISITDGNLIMASGHGIDFSNTADSSGTMSSELFDDYEEGSFTPAYQTSNNDIGTITYDNSFSPNPQGRYIKIGRLVYFTLRIETDAISSVGTGFIDIIGLPFTHVNNAHQRAVTHNIYSAAWRADDAPSIALIQNNQTRMRLYQKEFNEDSNNMPVGNFDTGTNHNDVRITGMYEASS